MRENKIVIEGPSWDNSPEYQSFHDPQIQKDLNMAEELIISINEKSAKLTAGITKWLEGQAHEDEQIELEIAQEISVIISRLRTLYSNLSVYANCTLSVDGQHEEAKSLLSKAQSLTARGNAAFQTQNLWLTLAPESVANRYLANPLTQPETFFVEKIRSQKDVMLTLEEEKLIKQLEVNGPTAWGNLYNQISTSLKCVLPIDGREQSFGIAKASTFLESPNSEIRKLTFETINLAWEEQAEACAASINALTGWRQEIFHKRSRNRSLDCLDEPLHLNAMTRPTLNAMLESIASQKNHAREGLNLQAKLLGLPKLGPWDLFAPFPHDEKNEDDRWSFQEAIQLIKEAFARVHPDMADFVELMVQNRWIEGTLGDRKRPGAYCTKFLKSRTPRVYMSYSGGIKDVITLAHELGHAFHNWVMRDLPLAEISYPMTLAETASILSQTLVTQSLLEQAKDARSKLKILWSEVREVEVFLLNIPVRFDFEKALYDKRKEQYLSVSLLRQLMSDAWTKWYGNSLAAPNSMFWASKLHFHIPSLSFYNFPYSFGYLFSLGVLSQRPRLGSDFYRAYVNLLRDTGRMTAEEVAKKHLNVDLTQNEFWISSLKICCEKVDDFRRMIETVENRPR